MAVWKLLSAMALMVAGEEAVPQQSAISKSTTMYTNSLQHLYESETTPDYAVSRKDASFTAEQKHTQMLGCFSGIQRLFMDNLQEILDESEALSQGTEIRADDAQRHMYNGFLLACYHNAPTEVAEMLVQGTEDAELRLRLIARGQTSPIVFSDEQRILLDTIAESFAHERLPGTSWLSGKTGLLYMLIVIGAVVGAFWYIAKTLREAENMRQMRPKTQSKVSKKKD